MRINTVTEAFKTELRKTENAKKVEKNPKAAKAVGDRLEFSSSAQRLSETKANVEVAAAQIASTPDVRPEKIAEVKAKIEQGYYNTDEFIGKLADKLMTEFGIKSKS
jgi:flagellar biosynthesis anti-sigma factor FlgM